MFRRYPSLPKHSIRHDKGAVPKNQVPGPCTDGWLNPGGCRGLLLPTGHMTCTHFLAVRSFPGQTQGLGARPRGGRARRFPGLARRPGEDRLRRAVEALTDAGAEPFPWQRPAAEVPPVRWDTVVVGAGPAGSLAAFHLARHGYRVLLLDRDRFPRDKTCGDLLIADALQALARAGLLDPVRALAHEVAGFRVFSPSRVHFELPGRYLMLKRRRLDALLARRAAEAGAVFVRGRVEDVSPTPGGAVACSVAGCPEPVEARAAVVATGAAADLLGRLGLPVRRRADAMAARCYVRSRLPLDRLV